MYVLRATVFLLAATALTSGCGGPALGEVSGTISYDGKIVEQGSISFIPADGSGPSTGGAITEGKFAVQKVPVGTAKVVISGTKVTGKKQMFKDPNSPFVQTSEEYLPAKYNDPSKTELSYEVKSGVQSKNFELAK
jgi:hypothetical protein